MGTARMTQFDTELEERTRQRAQNLFQNAVAPPGPPAATATTEKKTSPVTINVGGGIESSNPSTAFNPTMSFLIPKEMQRGLGSVAVGAAGLPVSWGVDRAADLLNAANRGLGAMTGYQFPGTIERNRTQDALDLIRMGGRDIASSLGMVPAPTRTTPTFSIPNDIAISHTPGLAGADRVIEMAKAPGGGYEAAPSNVGWFQIEGGPKTTITDEYWKTPMTGRGSFNVIPGSAAGPAWAAPVTVRMFGKDYTLPAATVAELGNTFQREGNRTPKFEIPTDMQNQMDAYSKIIQAPQGAYTTGQRAAAASALNNLNTQATQMNQQAIDVWKAQMGYPLEERKTTATEMGALAHAKTAEAQLMMAGPHADYFKKLAAEGTLVPPGYAIFNPETRKAMFENPAKSEAFAPLARDALLASTEDSPTGKVVNPFAFMGYMNLMGKTVSRERGQEWKDITVKDMNKEMVAPYIHRIIQTNPKTMKLKPTSKEYQQLYNDTLRELYKE